MSPREYDHGRGTDDQVAESVAGVDLNPDDETAFHTERVHRAAAGFYSGASEAVDLDGMTKADLVALADERGVDSSGTKADIIGRLGGE